MTIPTRAQRRARLKVARSPKVRLEVLAAEHRRLVTQYNGLVELFGAVLVHGDRFVHSSDVDRATGKQIKTEKVPDGIRVYLAPGETEVVTPQDQPTNPTGEDVAQGAGGIEGGGE